MNMKPSNGGGPTLLAQLGFADKDRFSPRHDLAVAYAAGNALTLVRRIDPQAQKFERASPECRVCRPGGFVIGFADLVVTWRPSAAWLNRDGVPYADGDYHVLVEVKITRCSAGDVIRQIEAYRAGSPFVGAILLCDFAISSAEKALLESKGIIPMRLGPGFEAFVRAQAMSDAELESF